MQKEQGSMKTIKKNNAADELKPMVVDEIWKVYQQSSIPTIIRDVKKKKHLRYNRAMYNLTGYTHQEVEDLTDWLVNLYPDETYRKFLTAIINHEARRNFNHKAFDLLELQLGMLQGTFLYLLLFLCIYYLQPDLQDTFVHI